MKTKVDFTLSAEIVSEATSGLLLGDFNNWDKESAVSLKRKKDGALKTTLFLETGETYEYRYLLNDGRWVNDDRAGQNIENCVLFVAAENVKPDDLTKIEGVGKKIAELLIAENITTFEALSNASLETLQNMLESAGNRFKIYNPASWSKQAQLAAESKWDALKSLQKELKIKKS